MGLVWGYKGRTSILLLLLTSVLCAAPAFAVHNHSSFESCSNLLQKGRTLRIGIAQVAVTVGDFKKNTQKILHYVDQASKERVELLVFPEMAISAYPPRDLLERSDFINANEQSLQTITREIQKIRNAPKTIVIGSIVSNPKATGKALWNAAVVIQSGKIVHVQPKQLLPTYDVFDETRYFEAGDKTMFLPFSNEKNWACTVCEDVWDPKSNERLLYKTSLASQTPQVQKAQLIVNLSASPFERNKLSTRFNALSEFASRTHALLVYANQVGAHDDLLFDGSSAVHDSQGKMLWRLPSFEETLGVADIFFGKDQQKLKNPVLLRPSSKIAWQKTPVKNRIAFESEIHQIYLGLLTGIKDYLKKTGFKKVVLGLSGGIDSSVVATLLADAIGPENVVGVLMPSKYNSKTSFDDAMELGKRLGIQTLVAPIQNQVDSVYSVLGKKLNELSSTTHFKPAQNEATEDNIQARMRGLYLMAFANKFGMLVVNTSNKSELALGQCTIYGDMAGALDPIGDLFKTEVYALAHHLNVIGGYRISHNVFTKAPSAELAPGQTDEAKFGPFSILDQLLRYYLEDGLSAEEIVSFGYDRNYVEKTIAYITKNEFKRRQSTVIFKVSKRAFGPGRRMPIAAKLDPERI